jgi:hypothetical protein
MVGSLKSQIFGWLVEYHCQRNLASCEQFMDEGVVVSPSTKKPLREGLDENELYKGLLIIANGDTLLEKLVDNGILSEENIDEFHNVGDKSAFFKYLDSRKNGDGAFIYDTIHGKIARVYELNNNPVYTKNGLADRLPSDFIHYTGEAIHARDIGTKTRLAIKLPQVLDNIETFQIKRTAYTEVGMGKVTHFTKEGLKEEFFFAPNENKFLSGGSDIKGMYREYSNEGKLERTDERELNCPPSVPIQMIYTNKELDEAFATNF